MRGAFQPPNAINSVSRPPRIMNQLAPVAGIASGAVPPRTTLQILPRDGPRDDRDDRRPCPAASWRFGPVLRPREPRLALQAAPRHHQAAPGARPPHHHHRRRRLTLVSYRPAHLAASFPGLPKGGTFYLYVVWRRYRRSRFRAESRNCIGGSASWQDLASY